MYGGASDGGAAAAEKKRQASINQGMSDINSEFSGFNDNYYKGVANDYLNYATPQMMQQYQQTKNQLSYSLARNGLLNSGAAVQKNQSLGNELATQESNLANSAQSEANTKRAAVSDAQTNATNELISSGSPELAQEQAGEATAGLRTPSAFAPIGNLFGDWSQMYMANNVAQAETPGTPNLWQMLSMGGNGGGGSAYSVM
jgi:hypothetical protein